MWASPVKRSIAPERDRLARLTIWLRPRNERIAVCDSASSRSSDRSSNIRLTERGIILPWSWNREDIRPPSSPLACKAYASQLFNDWLACDEKTVGCGPGGLVRPVHPVYV